MSRRDDRWVPPPCPFDPAGCRAALATALADPHLPVDARVPPTQRGRAAALALAVAVGRCELFGVWPRPTAGAIGEAVVRATAVEVTEQLLSIAADVTRSHPVVLLVRRLGAWAAYVGLADALDDAGPVLDAADAADAALERLGRPLAVAAGDTRVRQWRAALAPPYRDLPPWWLAEAGS